MMKSWLGGQAEVGAAILSEAQDRQDVLQLRPSEQGEGGGEEWASSVRGDTCHTGRPWL